MVVQTRSKGDSASSTGRERGKETATEKAIEKRWTVRRDVLWTAFFFLSPLSLLHFSPPLPSPGNDDVLVIVYVRWLCLPFVCVRVLLAGVLQCCFFVFRFLVVSRLFLDTFSFPSYHVLVCVFFRWREDSLDACICLIDENRVRNIPATEGYRD